MAIQLSVSRRYLPALDDKENVLFFHSTTDFFAFSLGREDNRIAMLWSYPYRSGRSVHLPFGTDHYILWIKAQTLPNLC